MRYLALKLSHNFLTPTSAGGGPFCIGNVEILPHFIWTFESSKIDLKNPATNSRNRSVKRIRSHTGWSGTDEKK